MTEANCYFLICSRSRTRRSLEAKPTAGAPGGLEIASCFYCYRCKYLNVSSFCLLFFFFLDSSFASFIAPQKKREQKAANECGFAAHVGLDLKPAATVNVLTGEIIHVFMSFYYYL